MPSEKRARQRALRQLRAAQVERKRRRVRRFRRIAGAVLVAALVIGIIFLVSSKSPKSAGKPSTTTATTASAAAKAIVPTCPPATAQGAAKRETTFTKAPPMCVPSNAIYDAQIKTTAGTFVVKMPVAASPLAVNNFVFLARYHLYDGTPFHRVIPGFVVQGGDPTGSGNGGPGYSFTGNTPPSSCTKKLDCYPLGSVAMANSGTASSDGSQFFVVVGPAGEQLPAKYTLFGTVVSGMPVVDKIASKGSVSGTPTVRYTIVKVTITKLAS